jgi:uridine kinase
MILLAFYLNSVLDRRAEKRVKRELEDRGGQP